MEVGLGQDSDCDLLQGRKINVEEWSYEPVILQK